MISADGNLKKNMGFVEFVSKCHLLTGHALLTEITIAIISKHMNNKNGSGSVGGNGSRLGYLRLSLQAHPISFA